jgi:exosome complex component RRP4
MAISILPPAPAAPSYEDTPAYGSVDSSGNVQMCEDGHAHEPEQLIWKGLVTPGESVTDDPQWMR